jgi:hypothetical protein
MGYTKRMGEVYYYRSFYGVFYFSGTRPTDPDDPARLTNTLAKPTDTSFTSIDTLWTKDVFLEFHRHISVIGHNLSIWTILGLE